MAEIFCPYFKGSIFDVQVLFKSDMTSPQRSKIRVEDVFLPFTKSQTMRIQTLPSSPHTLAFPALSIPSSAILKVYDRRWIDDRDSNNAAWSPSREAAARERWKGIACGDRVDDYDTVEDNDFNEAYEEEEYRRLCVVGLSTFVHKYLAHPSSSGTV